MILFLIPNYLKNGVFWDVTPCGSCKNRRFGGGARFLRNVSSYKSHTALTSQKTPFFIVTAVKNLKSSKLFNFNITYVLNQVGVSLLKQEPSAHPAHKVSDQRISNTDRHYHTLCHILSVCWATECTRCCVTMLQKEPCVFGDWIS
jgi:hypothetical protein